MPDELDVAIAAAQVGGGVALEQAATVVAELKGERDVVTAADLAVEALIRERINRAFPDDVVVGEEGEAQAETALRGRRRWYVDPIDGTKNFSKGRDRWAVSVAFCDVDDRVRAGVVHAPAIGVTYTAECGGGTRRDGGAVRCGRTRVLADALCASGFPVHATTTANLAAWAAVVDRALGARSHGAVALDLCEVADGRLDALWLLAAGRWDVAAGLLIAREAGAIVTDLAGRDLEAPTAPLVAAVPGIHEELLALLASVLG